MKSERFVKITSVTVSVLIALSAMTVLVSSTDGTYQTDISGDLLPYSVQAASTPFTPDTSTNGNDEGSVLDSLKNISIPDRYVYLPNIGAALNAGDGLSPLYSSGPAPMGITDYGFMEPSGLKIPYTYNTDSFMGTAMFESLNVFYAMNCDPGSISVQLNAVLSGVTLDGVAGYDFWIQNVAYYTPSTNQVMFVANIWNLSTPSLEFPAASVYSGSGEVVQNIFYYFAGPTLETNDSLSINLYLTSGTDNGKNAVYFSYAISESESDQTPVPTVYDIVVFNSGTSTPPPCSFRVDGFEKTASGLLYDVELVLGGPGKGSMTTVYGANGQLHLMYMNADGAYTRLAAAYNYGSNAGETVQSLSVWWSSLMKPFIHLSSGPSILVSMWGSQVSHSGAVNIQGRINPPNAFVFISMGSEFNSKTAAWAPIGESGSYKFSLPGRITYSGMIIMSEYQPYSFIVAAGESGEEGGDAGGCGGGSGGHGGGSGEGNETATYVNATLTFDRSMGIYTPLYASGNDQLKYLTVGTSEKNTTAGTGMIEDPYLIENDMNSRINALFSRINNFGYPEFSGIFITGTSASVILEDMPPFEVNHAALSGNAVKSLGFPDFNSLNSVFYNTAGVTVYRWSSAGGWFTPFMNENTVASIMFEDSCNFLVAGNTFTSMGHSLLVYNSNGTSGSGTIWGNFFHDDFITDSKYAKNILRGTDPSGLEMFSSGNLIYNNYFDSKNSAHSPAHGLTESSSSAGYLNDWNLTSKHPLSFARNVNGIALSGSIVDVGYQAGNYWSSFNGNIPYNCSGAIGYGGDFYPLIVPEYNVTFVGRGYAKGLHWGVSFDGIQTGSNASALTLQARNGTHTYIISGDQNYRASPSSGIVFVYGSDITVNVTFTEVLYDVTFTQTGLEEGSVWSVNLSGQILSSASNNIIFARSNGSYAFAATGPDHYGVSPSSGSIDVRGSDVQYFMDFTFLLHRVVFNATGLPIGSLWSVDIGGMHAASTAGNVTLMLENGVYDYSVTAPDQYVSEMTSGTLTVLNGDVFTNVGFGLRVYSVTFNGLGLPSEAEWSIALNGTTYDGTGSTILLHLTHGNYSYSVNGINGYTTNESSGYVNVTFGDREVNIHFAKNPGFWSVPVIIAIGAIAVASVTGLVIYALTRKPKE